MPIKVDCGIAGIAANKGEVQHEDHSRAYTAALHQSMATVPVDIRTCVLKASEFILIDPDKNGKNSGMSIPKT